MTRTEYNRRYRAKHGVNDLLRVLAWAAANPERARAAKTEANSRRDHAAIYRQRKLRTIERLRG